MPALRPVFVLGKPSLEHCGAQPEVLDMKLAFTIVTLAVAIAVAPVSAQARTKAKTHKRDQNVWWQAPREQGPRLPQARRARSPNPGWDVYYPDGRYAGSDPDPRIRMNLYFDDPNNDP
jgi:DMSO/TMAO reductase YedYZ molybdopterin-dependent catalytic subunit